MLSRLVSPFRSFARRPAADWGLLAEAIGILICSKIRLHTTPFARLAGDLGTPQAETMQRVSAPQRALASKISWAVQTAARYIPLRLVCLPQALAANVMLSRRGIDSTLYLGVKMDKANALTAHAWLRAGLKWVTGGAARRGQSVVACFAKTEITPISWSARFRIMILLGILTGLAVFTLLPSPPLYDLTWRNQPDWLRGPIHLIGSHDAWFNFVGFTATSLLFNFSLYGCHRAPLRFRLPGVIFFTLLISLLEIAQLALPGRNFDLMDIAMGLLAAIIVFPIWIKAKN